MSGFEWRWQRLIEHSKRTLAKPTYEEEERRTRLAAADELKRVLEIARDGGTWWLALEQTLLEIGLDRKYDITFRPRYPWLRAITSSRTLELFGEALAAFPNGGDPEERLIGFVEATTEACWRNEIARDLETTIAVGSLFNFALDPEHSPIISTEISDRLQWTLGCPWNEEDTPLNHYRRHVAFHMDVANRFRDAGLPVRDMIDVQALIFHAVNEEDFWAAGAPRPALAYLAVCACYRDEAPYLAEWIEFHRQVGVERFFLYDNLSTDHHRDVLAPYEKEGVVTVHEWPVYPGQNRAYADCLRWHRFDSRWIAFIDIDEFLFSPTGQPLPELLSEYEDWPAVAVNWALYGASGHRTMPAGLVIESYTRRYDTPANTHMKSIVDPARAVDLIDPHRFVYSHLGAVDENHHPVRGSRTESVSFERLRINHYSTKSDEELVARQRKPDAGGVGRKRKVPSQSSLDARHEKEERLGFEDTALVRYAPAVAAALASRKRRAADLRP